MPWCSENASVVCRAVDIKRRYSVAIVVVRKWKLVKLHQTQSSNIL